MEQQDENVSQYSNYVNSFCVFHLVTCIIYTLAHSNLFLTAISFFLFTIIILSSIKYLRM